MVAAAIVLLLIAPQLLHLPSENPSTTTLPKTSTERIKGLKPSLALFIKTKDGSGILADGDTVHAGDLIRVGYRAVGRPYGMILSIDGNRMVTLHLPHAGGHAASLKSEQTVLLNEAYELDNAPRFERFFLITSYKPFQVEQVLETARHTDLSQPEVTSTLPLSNQFEQTSVILIKGTRP